MQEYLGSMEGAVLSGKLAVQAIAQDYPAASKATDSEIKVTTTAVVS